MLVFLGANVLVVDHTVVFEVLDAGVEGDVGDEEGVDLGGRGCRDEEGQSLGGDTLEDHLDFVGGEEGLLGVDRADLKAVEVGEGLPLVGLALGGDEGDDLLARDAGGEGGSVDLVVASLDEVGGLCEEEEVDFGPLGVGPVCPDDEGEDGVAVGVDGLDGEEEIIGGCALEVVDTWVRRGVPMATLGGQSKGVVRVWL